MLPFLLLLLGGGAALVAANRSVASSQPAPRTSAPSGQMTIMPYVPPSGQMTIMPFPGPMPSAAPRHPTVHWTSPGSDVMLTGSQSRQIADLITKPSHKAQYDQFDPRGRPKPVATLPAMNMPRRAVTITPIPLPRRDMVYIGGSPVFDERGARM